jgi:hypothetical protein
MRLQAASTDCRRKRAVDGRVRACHGGVSGGDARVGGAHAIRLGRRSHVPRPHLRVASHPDGCADDAGRRVSVLKPPAPGRPTSGVRGRASRPLMLTGRIARELDCVGARVPRGVRHAVPGAGSAPAHACGAHCPRTRSLRSLRHAGKCMRPSGMSCSARPGNRVPDAGAGVALVQACGQRHEPIEHELLGHSGICMPAVGCCGFARGSIRV